MRQSENVFFTVTMNDINCIDMNMSQYLVSITEIHNINFFTNQTYANE